MNEVETKDREELIIHTYYGIVLNLHLNALEN